MSSIARRGLIAGAALAVVAGSAAATLSAVAPPAHAEDGYTLTINTSGDRTISGAGGATGAGAGVSGVSYVPNVQYRLTNSTGTQTIDAACSGFNAAGNCFFSDVPNGSYRVYGVCSAPYQNGTCLASGPPVSSTSQENYFRSENLGVGPVTGGPGGSSGVSAQNYAWFPVTVSGSDTGFPMGNTTVASTANASTATDMAARSGRWAVSRYNPPPPVTCTRNVALLFDLSGSITQPLLDQYKRAATDFVNSLRGTATTVKIYTFGTTAAVSGNLSTSFLPGTMNIPGDVTRLLGYINGTPTTPGLTLPTTAQYTNWDAGIWQIANAGLYYNEALVLTDGDPTAMSSTGLPDAVAPVRTRLRAVENGIFAANALKSRYVRGTRIIAVGLDPTNAGLDNAGSIANLKAISGPTRNSDYYLIPFDSLDNVLEHLALNHCATLSITKDADRSVFDAVNQRIRYTYTVKNTSPPDGFTLYNIAVTDSRFPGHLITDCVTRTLAPQQSTTCTSPYYYTTQPDLNLGHVINYASATGNTENGSRIPSNEVQKTIPAMRYPALRVTKDHDMPVLNAVGDPVGYTYTITNIGNVPMHNVRLTDNKIPGPFHCTPAEGSTLNPLTGPGPHTMTCTATYLTTQADLNNCKVENRVAVTGTPPGGLDTKEFHADAIVPTAGCPAIEVEKSAAPRRDDAPGEPIHYTFVVRNTGATDLQDITVRDNVLGTITCPETSLAVGAAMTCHATHITTQADVDGGQIANTVFASGTTAGGKTADDEDDAEVTGGIGPAITIAKSASPGTFRRHGELIRYSYLVTNSGNVTLRNVHVTDTRYGAVSCPRTTLAPGESMTCHTTHAISAVNLDDGSIFNSSSATGTPPDGPPVTSDPSHAIVTSAVRPQRPEVPSLPEVPVTG